MMPHERCPTCATQVPTAHGRYEPHATGTATYARPGDPDRCSSSNAPIEGTRQQRRPMTPAERRLAKRIFR